MQTYTLNVDVADAGQRLDKFLSARLPEFSRSRLQQLIEQACVKRDGATISDASYKVKPLEAYIVAVPKPESSELVASDVALSIIYEDDDLLVIDKPAGMTVHPAPGHADDTLVNALLSHCGASLSGIGGVMRPGIVHRIDKDTSGLIVVAKHDTAHRHLSAQLADRTLSREYMAVVWGMPVPPAGKIETAIGRSPKNRQKMAVVKGGKLAITHYKVEEKFDDTSLVRCKLETGRTHQIRVHMNHIGHPLVGDKTYGGRRKTEFLRQALHAAELVLIHPKTGKTMRFASALPQDMQDLLEELRNA